MSVIVNSNGGKVEFSTEPIVGFELCNGWLGTEPLQNNTVLVDFNYDYSTSQKIELYYEDTVGNQYHHVVDVGKLIAGVDGQFFTSNNGNITVSYVSNTEVSITSQNLPTSYTLFKANFFCRVDSRYKQIVDVFTGDQPLTTTYTDYGLPQIDLEGVVDGDFLLVTYGNGIRTHGIFLNGEAVTNRESNIPITGIIATGGQLQLKKEEGSPTSTVTSVTIIKTTSNNIQTYLSTPNSGILPNGNLDADALLQSLGDNEAYLFQTDGEVILTSGLSIVTNIDGVQGGGGSTLTIPLGVQGFMHRNPEGDIVVFYTTSTQLFPVGEEVCYEEFIDAPLAGSSFTLDNTTGGASNAGVTFGTSQIFHAPDRQIFFDTSVLPKNARIKSVSMFEERRGNNTAAVFMRYDGIPTNLISPALHADGFSSTRSTATFATSILVDATTPLILVDPSQNHWDYAQGAGADFVASITPGTATASGGVNDGVTTSLTGFNALVEFELSQGGTYRVQKWSDGITRAIRDSDGLIIENPDISSWTLCPPVYDGISADPDQQLTLGSDGLPYLSPECTDVTEQFTVGATQNPGGANPSGITVTEIIVNKTQDITVVHTGTTFTGGAGAGIGISSVPFPTETANVMAVADIFSSTGDRINATTPSKTYTVILTPGTYYIGVWSGGNSSTAVHTLDITYCKPVVDIDVRFVETRCYEEPGAALPILDNDAFADEINSTQLATLPAGAHMRWTAPSAITLDTLEVNGFNGTVAISWESSTGENGSQSVTFAGGVNPELLNLGGIALGNGDTIDFTLNSISAGQMQLTTASTSIANGWAALQDYSAFANTSHWATRLITSGAVIEHTVNVYEDTNGDTVYAEVNGEDLTDLTAIPVTWVLCEQDTETIPYAKGVEVEAFPSFTTQTLVTNSALPTQVIDLGVDLSEVDFLDVSITANNSGEESRRLDLREFKYDQDQGGLLHWWDANGIRVRINTSDISIGRIYVAYLNTPTMRIERIRFRKLVDAELPVFPKSHRTKLKLVADTALATATTTQLPFDTVEYDIGGISDIANNQVVIVNEGLYDLHATIFNMNQNRVAQLFIRVNGNLVARNITSITVGDQTLGYSPQASTKVELVQGDVVTVEYYAFTATTTTSAMTQLTVTQLSSETVVNTTDIPIDESSAFSEGDSVEWDATEAKLKAKNPFRNNFSIKKDTTASPEQTTTTESTYVTVSKNVEAGVYKIEAFPILRLSGTFGDLTAIIYVNGSPVAQEVFRVNNTGATQENSYPIADRYVHTGGNMTVEFRYLTSFNFLTAFMKSAKIFITKTE